MESLDDDDLEDEADEEVEKVILELTTGSFKGADYFLYLTSVAVSIFCHCHL